MTSSHIYLYFTVGHFYVLLNGFKSLNTVYCSLRKPYGGGEPPAGLRNRAQRRESFLYRLPSEDAQFSVSDFPGRKHNIHLEEESG